MKKDIIINNINKFMKAKGIKQNWIADMLDMNTMTINNILNFKSKRVDLDELENIANALDLTIDELSKEYFEEPKDVFDDLKMEEDFNIIKYPINNKELGGFVYKTDREFPLNFSEIEDLFNIEPKEICKLLIQAKSIILYYTNCFGFHAKKSNGKYYALDFFNKNDVVIFLEPIIREMNYKDTKEIQPWYLDYFRALKNKVKALIYIDEKDYINLLKIGKPSLSNIELRVKTAFLNAFNTKYLLI